MFVWHVSDGMQSVGAVSLRYDASDVWSEARMAGKAIHEINGVREETCYRDQ